MSYHSSMLTNCSFRSSSLSFTKNLNGEVGNGYLQKRVFRPSNPYSPYIGQHCVQYFRVSALLFTSWWRGHRVRHRQSWSAGAGSTNSFISRSDWTMATQYHVYSVIMASRSGCYVASPHFLCTTLFQRLYYTCVGAQRYTRKYFWTYTSGPQPLPSLLDYFWELDIFYTYNNGSILGTKDWRLVTGEHIPGIGLQAEQVLKMNFDTSCNLFGQCLLSIIHWAFMSIYWLTLYDFGHISAIYYTSSGRLIDLSKFTVIHDDRYNVFVNETLFANYSTTLRDIIIPFCRYFHPCSTDKGKPEFLELNDTNRLFPNKTTIYRNYTCTERRMKAWFNLVISVFAADYAIIGSSYTILIFIAGRLHQRKQNSA